MCKFESTSSPGFRNIATTIQQWADKAPYLVQGRWFVEEQESHNRAIANVREIMSLFAVSSYPSGNLVPAQAYFQNENDESGSREVNIIQPLPSYQHVPSHRQLLSTGESFSTALPNSFFGGTLHPPSAAHGGYRSQLTLTDPAPRSRTASPRTPAFQQVGYVPPVAAGTSDNVASDCSAWQSQQEQQNYQRVSQPEIPYAPIQDIPPDSTGMARSGSGSFQFDLHHFQSGQPQPAHLQTLYPSEIESPPPKNKDDGT